MEKLEQGGQSTAGPSHTPPGTSVSPHVQEAPNQALGWLGRLLKASLLPQTQEAVS